jgi:hypothetical protein
MVASTKIILQPVPMFREGMSCSQIALCAATGKSLEEVTAAIVRQFSNEQATVLTT